MKHHMKLSAKPFNLVKRGEKVIESRLFDEKRKKLDLGDIITFTNSEDPTQVAEFCVIGLLRYNKFEDLFADYHPSMFGGTSESELLKEIKQFYSDEEETEFGVVGIKLGSVD